MSNKAFGFFAMSNDNFENPTSGSAFGALLFSYKVVTPSNVVTGRSVDIDFEYADTPLTIWQKVVSAVQADTSDTTLQVIPMYPSGFESLVLNNTY